MGNKKKHELKGKTLSEALDIWEELTPAQQVRCANIAVDALWEFADGLKEIGGNRNVK